jgi:hypothetical protein
MEIDQGQNWGRSAKGKKKSSKYGETSLIRNSWWFRKQQFSEAKQNLDSIISFVGSNPQYNKYYLNFREIRQDTVKRTIQNRNTNQNNFIFKHIILNNLFYGMQYNFQNKFVLPKKTCEVHFYICPESIFNITSIIRTFANLYKDSLQISGLENRN